jgi:hypothetical protein
MYIFATGSGWSWETTWADEVPGRPRRNGRQQKNVATPRGRRGGCLLWRCHNGSHTTAAKSHRAKPIYKRPAAAAAAAEEEEGGGDRGGGADNDSD